MNSDMSEWTIKILHAGVKDVKSQFLLLKHTIDNMHMKMTASKSTFISDEEIMSKPMINLKGVTTSYLVMIHNHKKLIFRIFFAGKCVMLWSNLWTRLFDTRQTYAHQQIQKIFGPMPKF